MHLNGQVVNPAKVVDDILESFVRSKRTLFTRVMSSKIMCSSEKKDDKKFGDFVQELERSGTWILGRREVSDQKLPPTSFSQQLN
jgi:homogentisate solanesyltransferase